MSAPFRPAHRGEARWPLRRGLPALIGMICLLASTGASASTLSPLPASDYTANPVCGVPAPGRAGCLALRLLPLTAAARAHTHPLGFTRATQIKGPAAREGSYGLRPEDLRTAYFPGEPPEASSAQTIALVDAYYDRDAATDLETYATEFGLPVLPRCATGDTSDCFEQVNESGETGNPPIAYAPAAIKEAEEWALETATDIEVAHAICQNCRILLVETDSANYPDLEAGEQTAFELGAREISDSWGGEEPSLDSGAFNHPGVVITAAAGDEGYLNWTEAKTGRYYSGADYPASSPHVVAVGGTHLSLSESGVKSETVWNDGEKGGAGGGGCSHWFTAQPWQSEVSDWSLVGCNTRRAVADVSADADPFSGVAVYDSVPYPLRAGHGSQVIGWTPIGGTSVASPIIASMFALAGGADGVEYPAKTIYSHIGSALLYDATEGGNGECHKDYSDCGGSLSSPFDCGSAALICNAASGYDGPTGVGSPNSVGALEPIPQQVEHETQEREKAEKEAKEEKEREKRAKEQQEAEQTKPSTETNGPETKALSGETKHTNTTQTGQSPSGAQNTGGGGSDTQTNSSSLVAPRPKPQPTTAPRISSLKLSPGAVFALSRGLTNVAALNFVFTISAAARVSVRLSRQISVDQHQRWRGLSHKRTLAAVKGANHSRLGADLRLTAGRYLLTLTPLHGAARSIAFRVR